MTMARVKDGEVVAYGIPERMKGTPHEELIDKGWRPVKGTPKPDDAPEGMGYVYGKPYSYNAEDDAVYGTWSQADVAAIALEEKRNRAVLSRARFKLALEEMGELDNVEAAMAADGVDRRAKILWEDAGEFRRMDEDLLRLTAELGYTDEQIDAVFGIS